MKQSITCKICGQETEKGHGYQLPEILAIHMAKNHPLIYASLCQINQEIDKLESQSKKYGVYHRDLFYYRYNRLDEVIVKVDYPKSGKLKLK